MMRRTIRAALTATLAVALSIGAATAQAKAGSTQSKGGEKTVEEAYLQESAEAMMVKELSRSDDKEGKLLALDYARKSMDAAGRTTISAAPCSTSRWRIPRSSYVAPASAW